MEGEIRVTVGRSRLFVYQKVKKMIVSAYVVRKRELRRNIRDPLHHDRQYIWIPKY